MPSRLVVCRVSTIYKISYANTPTSTSIYGSSPLYVSHAPHEPLASSRRPCGRGRGRESRQSPFESQTIIPKPNTHLLIAPPCPRLRPLLPSGTSSCCASGPNAAAVSKSASSRPAWTSSPVDVAARAFSVALFVRFDFARPVAPPPTFLFEPPSFLLHTIARR